MRALLKECAWEALGDTLVVVRDPCEALTLEDSEGQVAALLEELSRGAATPAELRDRLAMTLVDRDDAA